MRAGIYLHKFDVNFFVNNVFNSTDPLGLSGGRSQCSPNTDANCATYGAFSPFTGITTFRPRTVGVQLNYKY